MCGRHNGGHSAGGESVVGDVSCGGSVGRRCNLTGDFDGLSRGVVVLVVNGHRR